MLLWFPVRLGDQFKFAFLKYNPVIILFPVIAGIQISWKKLLMVPPVGVVYNTVTEDKTI